MHLKDESLGLRINLEIKLSSLGLEGKILRILTLL